MAHKVEFIKSDKINKQEIKKGTVMSVGDSLYKTLNENESIKDYIEKKSKRES